MSISNTEVLETLETSEEVKTTKTLNIFLRFVKRIFDILIGIIGIIILVPVTIIVYITRIILHENDGPIFYTQLRIGKNGKTFKLYKYRTMVIGAEEKLQDYLKENKKARKEFKENQKLANDPRITRVGKFLRRLSLDEMPQFINVLKGDMSLIGPRPLIKGELDAHNGNHEIYESIRPGITGWWAANGRSNTTYEERLELEYYYIENISLILDIKCMFKTIKAVARKTGAK